MSAAEARAAATAGRCLLTLPAATPYERQLLVQCIQRTVARWGVACVAVGRREVLVVDDPATSETRCARCNRSTGTLRCRGAGPRLCLGCALKATLPDGCAGATIATGGIAPGGPHAERSPHGESHSSCG